MKMNGSKDNIEQENPNGCGELQMWEIFKGTIDVGAFDITLEEFCIKCSIEAFP